MDSSGRLSRTHSDPIPSSNLTPGCTMTINNGHGEPNGNNGIGGALTRVMIQTK